MKNRLLLTAFVAIAYTHCFSQNFSGLQYKKLNKLSDVGSMLESGLGSLFSGSNKMSGNVDSVVVSWDSELMLKVKIYFTGFENSFITVSAMDGARKQQNEISFAKTTEAGARRPIEMTLSLDPKVPKGTKIESPYLRIDFAKDYNKLGKVLAYSLNKYWKTDLDPQNVIVNVDLSPIGKAASLTSEIRDVTPTRVIRFDPRRMYEPAGYNRNRRSGGNQSMDFNYSAINLPDDISGTWLNTDGDTKGITKLIVTNNNSIQGFGKCSPQDCDWGATTLSGSGNNYRAVYSWSFKTTTLTITYADDQLNVAETDVRIPGGATSTYNYTFKKNVQFLTSRTNMLTLTQASALSNVQGFAAASTVAKGPSNQQFSLINSFSADVDFARPQDISNINLTGFLDKNPASGVVYVLPADYHLKFEPKASAENGYNFRILYGSQSTTTAAADNTDAPVRMSATLTAGVSLAELVFIKTLLNASFNNKIKEVRFLPLRENPQFTFQNTLGSQYNIPQNKILVETTTDLGSDIKVSWQTDADTKEFIQTALTSREGIAASVVLKPADEEIIDQQIPASINIADTRTLGKISLQPNAWRNGNWRNLTPYPLQLNYLHVLKKENNGTNPIIYSWSANSAVIPPQAQAAFNSNIIPAWLDNAAGVVMWVDYTVMDCSDCDAKVMNAVTGGVAGGKSQQVKFTIPPAVFDTLNASYFLVTIRSKQVDPKGEELKELDALKITKETGEASAGPLFVSTGGIDFEYKITAATADGDFFPAANWIKATSKEVLLGKTRMKEIFKGIIPGIN